MDLYKIFEKVKYLSIMVNDKHENILTKYPEIWDRTKELRAR